MTAYISRLGGAVVIGCIWILAGVFLKIPMPVIGGIFLLIVLMLSANVFRSKVVSVVGLACVWAIAAQLFPVPNYVDVQSYAFEEKDVDKMKTVASDVQSAASDIASNIMGNDENSNDGISNADFQKNDSALSDSLAGKLKQLDDALAEGSINEEQYKELKAKLFENFVGSH